MSFGFAVAKEITIMKKTFTLVAALLISATMFAFNGRGLSKMIISTTGNNSIRVMVDNVQYNTNGDKGVRIDNLEEGYHTIRIFQKQKGRRGIWGFGGGNNYTMIYNSSIYVRNQYLIDITVNRFGRVFKDEEPMSNRGYDMDDWNDGGWNNNPGPNNDPNWNNNPNWNNYPGNNGYGYYQAMDARSFDKMIQTLKNESFENSRVSIAKQAISGNYFTTDQLKQVLNLFVFESYKLDVAKYAYKFCIDRGNYYTLADSFTFSTSKDELMKYIRENQ